MPACTHAHTHTQRDLLQAGQRELEVQGVRDREKVSPEVEPRHEGRRNLRMSHREREIVPDGVTSE